MGLARIKKIIRRLQKGPLQRRNARRIVKARGTTPQRSRSATDSAIASSGLSTSSTSSSTSRLLSPGAITRSQGSRNLTADRSEARRSRADATASKLTASSPQVNKQPPLKRQNNKRNLNLATGKPKRDFATGRTLFPVEGDGGKIQYVPIAKEATSLEVQNGAFIADAAVQKDPVNTLEVQKAPVNTTAVKLASLRDFATGRTVFATKTADGKRVEYLPKESEATALELSQGKYVPDAQVEVAPPRNNEVLNKPPLRDFATGRTVFAIKANGRTEYLPKRSEATALELSQGRYVDDEDVSAKAPLGAENAMSNLPSKYDVGKGRKVYAVKTPDGKTIYLPREGDADGLELAKGIFIPDDIVAQHESQRRRTALQDNAADNAQRRAQRAAKLPAGVNRRSNNAPPIPVRKAKDGTEDTVLWDGFTPPDVSEEKQQQTLEKLRPKYDIGKGRMLYPTETAQGKVEYLPLFRDARPEERFLGLYAAFVPPESLQDFLANAENQGEITRRSFASDRGNVKAYAQKDIDTLFDQAPTLVLRSAQLVSDSARQTPQLQQQFNSRQATP